MNQSDLYQFAIQIITDNGVQVEWNATHVSSDTVDNQPWKAANTNATVVTTQVTIAFLKNQTSALTNLLHFMVKSDVPAGTRKAYVVGPPNWQPSLNDTLTVGSYTMSVQSVDTLGAGSGPYVFLVTFSL